MKNTFSLPTNTDGIIIAHPINIFYLTGFMGSFGLLFLKKSGQKILATDGRYKSVAQSLSQKNQFHFALFDENFAKNFAQTLRGTWAVEDTLSLRRFEQFKSWFSGAELVVEKNWTETLRRKKTETETEHTQNAATHTDECIKKVLPKIKLGMPEAEVSKILKNLIEANGSEESFENIVAFGENTAKPHHKAGSKKLTLDTPILIDCGSKFNRYCSDMTRNFWFGNNVLPEYQNAYKSLLKTQSEANTKFVSGTLAKDIDIWVRNKLGTQAEYFTHSLGHGTGLEIHEAPSISKKSNEILQINDIVTNEPGLYFDGQFGIRIEDQLVVKEHFNEGNILTKSSKQLIKI